MRRFVRSKLQDRSSVLKSSDPQIQVTLGVMSQHVLAIVPRTPDGSRPRSISRRHAFRSPRAGVLPCWMPAAQGAVRSVGNGQAGAAALSRRPHRRSGRRTRLARPGAAAARQFLARRARRRQGAAASSAKLHEALVQAWPRLSGRIAFVAGALDDLPLLPTDLVVSSHACGALTDRVLEGAAAARARVAVLPCCHDLAVGDAGDLSGWVDAPTAIDLVRAVRLKQQGYRIWTQTIPAAITVKNRLLLGAPRSSNSQGSSLKSQ